MEAWQKILVDGVNNFKRLRELFPDMDDERLRAVIKNFPVRVNSYYLSLIRDADDPIARQVFPDLHEIEELDSPEDPLSEENDSPAPGITHRYPDRVLFYVNFQCPIYCRYCTRKRKVGDPESIVPGQVDAGLEYIRRHAEVRDVILSGGDPLMLRDEAIVDVVRRLREIPHVEIIRIGTRVPNALPQRITPALCAALRAYHPIWMMVHFSHPRELTPEAKEACERLADHGFPLMNQTVLLRGVNDDHGTLKQLLQGLLRMRVKPYYLFQADLTRGANYFRTGVERGLQIMHAIRGHTSGLAVPTYVIDAPGGGGKIPLLPKYVLRMDDRQVIMRNYAGKLYRYPLPAPEPDAGTLMAPRPGGRRRTRR
ncbi:MAG: lysine 2,3-aminomutase [Candidatus Handelsmanbacteria bacterium RIFCSPLOWO2_12_FULL_64_10]|uniref:Lysine 2,3-aminomutase n=1 Tax=Handelsmanbacteria sp. (strain RIFCSPLOWO2_12_FULL_64_10) TaxID=1817868 RepID=A0A1F6CRJ6_HANXR|nr:MAG: lysine 2,3-aminomutase [Candidatus Handelsmanbacteria bacterium RIFCSPLOWO2_12_FULL_64_10]